jgi:hypothetical protein
MYEILVTNEKEGGFFVRHRDIYVH